MYWSVVNCIFLTLKMTFFLLDILSRLLFFYLHELLNNDKKWNGNFSFFLQRQLIKYLNFKENFSQFLHFNMNFPCSGWRGRFFFFFLMTKMDSNFWFKQKKNIKNFNSDEKKPSKLLSMFGFIKQTNFKFQIDDHWICFFFLVKQWTCNLK